MTLLPEFVMQMNNLQIFDQMLNWQKDSSSDVIECYKYWLLFIVHHVRSHQDGGASVGWAVRREFIATSAKLDKCSG